MLKRLKRMFGVAAPKVAVRAHIPWPLRGLVLALLLGVALGLAWWIYDAGRRFAGFDRGRVGEEVQRLAEARERLGVENDELRAKAVAAESQVQIERSAHEDLAKQVKALGDENARLKEDLAFFQNLMPAAGKDGGLQVYRFRVERGRLPGEYRYGLLLVQTGQRAKEFQGSLQLVLNVQHNGMQQVVTLPEDQKKFPRGQGLSFRYYQRVEGRFQVAPDAVVESLQLRVYANGAPDAALIQTAKVS